VRAAREHPRLTGAVAIAVTALMLLGALIGGALASGRAPASTNAVALRTREAALQQQLGADRAQNARLTGQIQVVQERFLQAQRAANAHAHQAPPRHAGRKR
jgi:hypothetical protein